MKTKPINGYFSFKNIRNDKNGNKYTELLFLQKGIPVEATEDIDNYNAKLPRKEWIEDRKTDVWILGESFKARMVRHVNERYFPNSILGLRPSFGEELGTVLTKYFGIKIFRSTTKRLREYPNVKIAFRICPGEFYCYEVHDYEKTSDGILKAYRDWCPLAPNDAERCEWERYDYPKCSSCYYVDIRKKENGKEQQIYCHCPVLKWPEQKNKKDPGIFNGK